MAEVVLGIGTSHTPQISIPWERWADLPNAPDGLPSVAVANIQGELEAGVLSQREQQVQHGVAELARVLQNTPKLDAIVIFGDDQHEQFFDDNMPAIAIYNGADVPIVIKHREGAAAWRSVEQERWVNASTEYTSSTALADHLLSSLSEQEFDVARTNQLREGQGIGHAFSFLYRRLWGDCPVPIVPVMLNTYYPPNQPTPRRAFKLGEAVRQAISEWDGGERVAVIASGGLSHLVVDEELDRHVLSALEKHDTQALCSLPREKLVHGTSEILNWVALAGAVGPLDMTLVEYVPGYRAAPNTGCAMTFAYWS
jgi:hypothetical protein